jgi:hypothetical protein
MKIFVMMPLASKFDPIYALVNSACRPLRLEPERKILEPGSVPERIFEKIRNSLFVIADVSEHNDNVFFELGYAYALQKEIILLSSRSQLPFDLSVHSTIFYSTEPGDGRIKEDGKINLLDELGKTIEFLYDRLKALEINEIEDGQELQGHFHPISGRLLRAEPYRHFWFFVKREDLDRWSPQNDGEVQVQPDGRWKAHLYLGWPNSDWDVNRYYDVKFGIVNTTDNRELTEFCIRCHYIGDFSGRSELPGSFEQLAHLKLKRIER